MSSESQIGEENMGLFKKKEKTIYPKQTFRIYLNESGKVSLKLYNSYSKPCIAP